MSDSLYRGTWETFLVFGMICVALIASMCSVVWFVKSYKSADVGGDTQRIRKGHRHRGDIESLGGSSGYSFDDTYSSSSNSHNNSLDTRSDYEVELDFEFSEDVNRPQEVVESNRAAIAMPKTSAQAAAQHQQHHHHPQKTTIVHKYQSFA